MQAIPFLQEVLQNRSENCMVRHEAGEAIGAIGCNDSLQFLENYVDDPSREVAETCILAIERIKRVKDEQEVHENIGMFTSQGVPLYSVMITAFSHLLHRVNRQTFAIQVQFCGSSAVYWWTCCRFFCARIEKTADGRVSGSI